MVFMSNYRVDFNNEEISSCIKVTKRNNFYDHSLFQGGLLPFAHLHPVTMQIEAILLKAKSEEEACNKAKAIKSF